MVYIVSFFCTIIVSYLANHIVIKSSERTKRYSIGKVGIVYFLFFFLAAFRWNLGVDSYYGIGHYSSGYLWASMGVNKYDYDIGFFKYFEICSKIGLPIFWSYFIITLLYFVAVVWMVKELELDLTWSVITFFGVDMLIFTFSAVRQTMALAFVIVALIYYFHPRKENKKIVFFLILLATTIHTTSALYFILFLLDYLVEKVYKNGLKRKNIRQMFLGAIFISPLVYIVIKNILSTSEYSINAVELTFTPTYLAFYLLLLYAGYKYRDYFLKENPKYRMLILAMLVFVILGIVSSAIYHMDRIFHLFIPIYFIYIPVLWKTVPKGRNKVFIFSMLIVIMIWMLKGYFLPGTKDYEVYGTYNSVFENWDYYTHLKGYIRY